MNRIERPLICFTVALWWAVNPVIGQHPTQTWLKTALHILVAPPSDTHKRSLKSVELMIVLGAEVNALDKSGSTPLKALVPCRNPQIGEEELAIIEAFVRAGANLDLPDNTGATPLACAIQAAHFVAAAKLISLGAELNPVLPGGQNYVHMAAQLDADKPDGLHILQALIVAGVDFDTLDDQGRTPMRIAVESGNAFAINVLMRSQGELVATGEIYSNTQAGLEISGLGSRTIKPGERLMVRTARGIYSVFALGLGAGRRKARTSPAGALNIQKHDKVYRKILAITGGASGHAN